MLPMPRNGPTPTDRPRKPRGARAARSSALTRGGADAPVQTLAWKDGTVRLIEQTLLPETFKVVTIRTPQEMWHAIRRLAVRGAPAIGCAAAYGVVLGVARARAKTTPALVRAALKAAEHLATSRPTAVNLFWALERMRAVAEGAADLAPADFRQRLLDEADAILEEDREMGRSIGRNGLRLVPKRKTPVGILTHCNAGGLATSGFGTALAVFFAAKTAGRTIHAFADETRPLLQGSRLTAWELLRAEIPLTLLCDNMAAQVMKEGRIDLVVVGADRIAANGDAANKIGTYGVAVLAKHHGIPFYIAAPSSTFDLELTTGEAIPIEERDPDEVRRGFGTWTAPRQAPVYNPAFDVTPARLIAGIITEKGVIVKPTAAKVRAHLTG
jgi:methylthioribose-1-phosphate isomerase